LLLIFVLWPIFWPKNIRKIEITTFFKNDVFLQVICSPGFNGGLPQNFTVDVVENEAVSAPLDSPPPVFHLESQDPVFAVAGLKDSTEYRVYVTPVNMKGVGQPQDPGGTLVRTNTEPKPLIEDPKNDGGGGAGGGGGKGFLDGEDGDGMNPLMVMIFGGATGLVFILATITLAAKVRCAGGGRNSGNSNSNSSDGGGGGRLSRHNSKVLVVTTIADMDFDEEKSNGGCSTADLDREDALYASSGGGGSNTRRPMYLTGSGGEGGTGSGAITSGYMRLPPDQQHQPLEYPSYLMCPSAATMTSSSAHAHNYCTLRKQPPHARMGNDNGELADGGESSAMGTTSGGSCSRLLEPPPPMPMPEDEASDDVNSPRELLLQMSQWDKHRAGFMYGTLRHPAAGGQRHNHQLPPRQFAGGNPLPPGAVKACRGEELGGGGGGGVVPPPPMFEEGGLVARSNNGGGVVVAGGTLKKCPIGKPEKKDKMESRV
jgi:hypothetical protein